MNASVPLSLVTLLLLPRIALAQTPGPAPSPATPPAATSATPAPATPPAPAATPPAGAPTAAPPTVLVPAPVPAPLTVPPPSSGGASSAGPSAAPPAAVVLPAPQPSAPPAAPPPGASTKVSVEFTSLRLMREKGVISQAEYDSAIKDLTESTGTRAPEQGTVVLGKWATTLYGFVEADNIYDTTRSFNDLAGSGQVARAESQGGQNGRFTMGVRNSRLGFRLKAPEVGGGVRASAMLEMDFLGTQAVGTGTGQVSEGAFFTQPLLRIRHFNFKVETPIVDFLVGQYWQLFGWESAYQPNTVELQGVPGELYARTPQIRISKTIKAKPVTVEIAVAATRPVQRDASTPDGQGGIRFAIDSWTGVQTVGATGTQISPLSIAATGLLRHVAVDQWAASPKTTNDLGMSAFALDAYIPVIPGTKTSKDNAFSFNGEYATGYGFADMYSSLSGGVSFPALPTPAGMTTAPTYTPDIDSGIVTYDTGGGLHAIQWTTMLFGAQYVLPGTQGGVWISGNYSHSSSDNAAKYVSASTATAFATALSKVRDTEDWFDVNLFFDPVPAVRVGLEYANFNDMYYDGHHAINHRGQISGFFIF